MLHIKKFRKIIEEELSPFWDDIKREVNQYFKIIDLADISFRKYYIKLSKPNEEFLNDPLNLPEIYTLLMNIKENNFDLFNRDSKTLDYDHYNHAYFIKDDLLPELEPLKQKIEQFRIDNFNNLLLEQKETQEKEVFISHNFKDYGLDHYNNYRKIINGIAYHNSFYSILPNLLRCLFENLLYDIFQTALDKKHTKLFFQESKARPRNFSQLITMLNILKDRDFKPYHKNTLNQNVIDVLKEIQSFGNLSVHQIIRQIDKDFAHKWKERINRILLVLLLLYRKIENKDLEIKDQISIKKINEKINYI